jgi:ferrous iron transport protein B
LESERDRILTILINPLMSCSARLPVYVLLAGTFFGASAGNVVFSIYGLGIALAILMGKLFRLTLFKGETAPFVMELPSYRMPTLKSLLIHMWDRSKIFVKKMGGVILIGSIVIWFLGAFPRSSEPTPADPRQSTSEVQHESAQTHEDPTKETERLRRSYLGRTGQIIQPVFDPLGFDWRTSVAVVTGFVAKEIVVSTLGVVYASGADADEESEALRRSLRASGLNPLRAYTLMAFVLIYVPCLATVAVIARETHSWKWAAFSIGYSLALAWIVCFVIYQGGRLLGLD